MAHIKIISGLNKVQKEELKKEAVKKGNEKRKQKDIYGSMTLDTSITLYYATHNSSSLIFQPRNSVNEKKVIVLILSKIK